MGTVSIVLQIIIALGIYNVWLLRSGKVTDWRGGDAKSLKEEFEVYGFPGWFFFFIAILKLSFATLLIAGIWLPVLTFPAAIGMAVLMAGAVVMHVKVKDPPQKSLPAAAVLIMCLIVAWVSST